LTLICKKSAAVPTHELRSLMSSRAEAAISRTYIDAH
jgi:hypothetical protein